MEPSELPLIKKAMTKASEYEATGDQINADIWFDLALKADAYYAKQGYKTAWELYWEKK
jgi:hypothetical protein